MAQRRSGPIIGRGSSATVTLASSSSGELFAVKSADLSNYNLLQNEQRILSTLDCPHIVTYLGFEVTHLHYNLLLEYATGGSLSDHIKNHGGRLDDPAVQSCTGEILTGLSYLHSRGIVHCDIKPQNILIGSDGRAMIADFGCARRMDEASYQVKGTPMFMAPEVARGEEQGLAADVWALGCTVLEMLTGSNPWPESEPISTLHNISFSTTVPQIPSWVSEEGKDFLRNCLVRDPKQRWTVDQLLQHPFAKFRSIKENQHLSWSSITPKSMLDTWETFSEEKEEDEEPFDDCKDRIRDLQGSCSDGPHWTWDESWVSIRRSEDCFVASMAGYDAVNTIPSQTTSTGSGSTQAVENLFLEFQTYNPVQDNSNSCLECINSQREEDEESFDDCNVRIRDLEGSCSDGLHWTWDESWVTIRQECSMVSMGDYDAVNSIPSQTTSSGSGSIQVVENLIFEFQNYNPVEDNSDSCLECINSFDFSLCTNKYQTRQLSSCKLNLIRFSNNSYDSGNNKHDGVLCFVNFTFIFNKLV